MLPVKLIVCDMAGTTVQDNREVEAVFFEAIRQTGLQVQSHEVNAMMGWSKIKVFEALWEKQIGKADAKYQEYVKQSYRLFTQLLEQHYLNMPVEPTEGALELFRFCRTQNIKIALTTGFYREVTDIILSRLGWNIGLNEDYVAENDSAVIDCSISSSDVTDGRPAPDMIFLAMKKLGIAVPEEVVNIGDTPSDLESGNRAGVWLSLGVSNGTHTYDELMALPNNGILPTVGHLIGVLKGVEASAL